MWAIRTILISALAAALIGFVYYNATPVQRVSINLYWWEYVDVPLLIVIFWAFVAGMVFSLMLFVGVYIKQLSQISSARRSIKGLNDEVAALRNRPIEESHDIFAEKSEKTESSKTAELN